MAKHYAHITFDNPADGVYRCDCKHVEKAFKKMTWWFSNPDDPTQVYLATDEDDILESQKFSEISQEAFEDKAGKEKVDADCPRPKLYRDYNEGNYTYEEMKSKGYGDWELLMAERADYSEEVIDGGN